MHTIVTPAEVELRERPKELMVHLPCGSLRGPVPADYRFVDLRGRWQSCQCEAQPDVWPDCDVSHAVDLCLVCFRGTAGSPSRWAWHACDPCLAANFALELAWGVRPFALGRHSIMNGVGVPFAGAPEVISEETARLIEFLRGDNRLVRWRQVEFARLAAAFDGREDVPLREWQDVHSATPKMSVDAFARLLARDGTR